VREPFDPPCKEVLDGYGCADVAVRDDCTNMDRADTNRTTVMPISRECRKIRERVRTKDRGCWEGPRH
jgi:hypothetical protein